METTPVDFDVEVRNAVYQHFVARASAPAVRDIADVLHAPPADVRAAYQRLFARRTLVVGGDGEQIIMAPPFSGVPTQHRVQVGQLEYFANCSWDSLGIPAALHQPAIVHTRCEQSREPITIPISGAHGPDAVPCLAHFAVPAARWWADIVFT